MKKLLIAGALALAAANAVAAEVSSILVVHDASIDPVRLDYRMNGVDVSEIDLGFGSKMDEQMTNAVTAGMVMPANITEADEERFESQINESFSRYAQTDEYRLLQQQMMAWGEKLAQLASLQITKAPAIVINGSVVIYGERSVNAAVEAYYSQVN